MIAGPVPQRAELLDKIGAGGYRPARCLITVSGMDHPPDPLSPQPAKGLTHNQIRARFARELGAYSGVATKSLTDDEVATWAKHTCIPLALSPDEAGKGGGPAPKAEHPARCRVCGGAHETPNVEDAIAKLRARWSSPLGAKAFFASLFGGDQDRPKKDQPFRPILHWMDAQPGEKPWRVFAYDADHHPLSVEAVVDDVIRNGVPISLAAIRRAFGIPPAAEVDDLLAHLDRVKAKLRAQQPLMTAPVWRFPFTDEAGKIIGRTVADVPERFRTSEHGHGTLFNYADLFPWVRGETLLSCMDHDRDARVDDGVAKAFASEIERMVLAQVNAYAAAPGYKPKLSRAEALVALRALAIQFALARLGMLYPTYYVIDHVQARAQAEDELDHLFGT